MVDICGYELTTNLQNLTQKYLTEVKIFQKVWGGGYFILKHPVCNCHRYVPRLRPTADHTRRL